MAWHNKFKKSKAFKKDINKKVMPVAWHPKKWWNWCLSDDKKKILY